MADRKVVIPTSSRFAVFETEDTESSENDAAGKGNEDAQNAKKKSKNAKKRARKKKKAASESAATNDLRNMAFGKPTSSSKPKASSEASKVKQVLKEQAKIPHKDDEKPPTIPMQETYETWIEKDEEYVLNQFQHDLQEAMKMSMVDASERKRDTSHTKKNKKENVVKLSLDEFQNKPAHSASNGHAAEGLNGESFNDDWSLEAPPGIEIKPEKEKRKKKKNSEKSTHKTEDVLENIKHDTKKELELVDNDGLHASSLAQWKSEMDSKDKENEKLKTVIEELKIELTQVKKRNKQLCIILGQGEMRDKSEILFQIEELTNVKDELSAELAEMHTSLEQERSKVSTLKLELAKHQGGSGRSKKHSSCEPDL